MLFIPFFLFLLFYYPLIFFYSYLILNSSLVGLISFKKAHATLLFACLSKVPLSEALLQHNVKTVLRVEYSWGG